MQSASHKHTVRTGKTYKRIAMNGISLDVGRGSWSSFCTVGDIHFKSVPFYTVCTTSEYTELLLMTLTIYCIFFSTINVNEWQFVMCENTKFLVNPMSFLFLEVCKHLTVNLRVLQCPKNCQIFTTYSVSQKKIPPPKGS